MHVAILLWPLSMIILRTVCHVRYISLRCDVSAFSVMSPFDKDPEVKRLSSKGWLFKPDEKDEYGRLRKIGNYAFLSFIVSVIFVFYVITILGLK